MAHSQSQHPNISLRYSTHVTQTKHKKKSKKTHVYKNRRTHTSQTLQTPWTKLMDSSYPRGFSACESHLETPASSNSNSKEEPASGVGTWLTVEVGSMHVWGFQVCQVVKISLTLTLCLGGNKPVVFPEKPWCRADSINISVSIVTWCATWPGQAVSLDLKTCLWFTASWKTTN